MNFCHFGPHSKFFKLNLVNSTKFLATLLHFEPVQVDKSQRTSEKHPIINKVIGWVLFRAILAIYYPNWSHLSEPQPEKPIDDVGLRRFITTEIRNRCFGKIRKSQSSEFISGQNRLQTEKKAEENYRLGRELTSGADFIKLIWSKIYSTP